MAADMLNTGLYGAQLADVQPEGTRWWSWAWGLWGLWPLPGAKGGRTHPGHRQPASPGWALAQFYGATDLVNYKEGDVTRQIHLLTHKQGADCCICAGGGPDALGAGCHHGPLGRHRGNVNYFYQTQGDLPIPMCGMASSAWGNKTIRGGECPGGARMEKLLAPCSNTRPGGPGP